jgi:cell division protein FtsN
MAISAKVYMGTTSLTSQRGGTFLGLIIGMIIGLGVAVAVALFITRAPVPFVDRVGTKATSPASAPGSLPDPNKSLHSKEAPKPAPADDSTTAPTTGGTAPASVPGTDGQFSLYNLLPGKPQENTAVPDKALAKEETKATDENKTRYLLQVGAYESETEADAARAKLALMGYEANISKRERDGKTLHRVRIGPIDNLDDMNRIRTALSQNKMEASVIRIPLTESTAGKTPAVAR